MFVVGERKFIILNVSKVSLGRYYIWFGNGFFKSIHVVHYVLLDIIYSTKPLYITVPDCQQNVLWDVMKLLSPHFFIVKSIFMKQKVANRSSPNKLYSTEWWLQWPFFQRLWGNIETLLGASTSFWSGFGSLNWSSSLCARACFWVYL